MKCSSKFVAKAFIEHLDESDVAVVSHFQRADAEVWNDYSCSLVLNLSPTERVAMAWAVLRTLTADQVLCVVETFIPESVGAPIAPLFNYMDEAAFWADMAEPKALEAYCLASYNAMSAARQAAFLKFVQGRWVA